MSNSNELKQLRQLAEYLRSAWYHGEWKAETPNEESMEKIMTELGYWPITDEWFWGNKTIGEPNPEDEWVVDEWGNRFKKSLFESFYDQPSTQVHGGEMNMSNNNPGTTTTTNITRDKNNTVTTNITITITTTPQQ